MHHQAVDCDNVVQNGYVIPLGLWMALEWTRSLARESRCRRLAGYIAEQEGSIGGQNCVALRIAAANGHVGSEVSSGHGDALTAADSELPVGWCQVPVAHCRSGRAHLEAACSGIVLV